MWIRLGSFTVKPGHAAQLSSTYHAQAVPRVRACAGNVACLLLEPASDGDDVFVACTLWRTRADGEAYEASGTAKEVVDLVRAHFAGPPTLRSYESRSEAAI